MMKLLLLAAAVGAAVAAPLSTRPMYSEQQYASQWESYKLEYGKNHTAVEEASRYAVFKTNVDYIDSQNKLGETDGRMYKLGLTEYTDWSHAEFVSTKLSGVMRSGERNVNTGLLNATAGADTVDWRTKGAVTPVKNQGQCGGCWAFSATGSMEGLSKIADGTLLDLSEQQLIDCSKKQGNQGCNGGLMDAAFKYAEADGMCSEESYKFKAKNGKCEKTCKTVFKITGHEDVPSKNEKALAAAVSKQPVSVAIEADKPDFQHYKSGVLSGKACGTKLDHGVLVVGYGVGGPDSDEAADQNYWVVKNSWGPSWGLKGYIQILKDGTSKDGECGIAMQPSYPTKKKALTAYSELADVA